MIRLMFNSEKGGTGKTTLSTLYAAFRAIRGDRVLLVDLDPQANATLSFDLEPTPGLYNSVVRGASLESQVVAPHPASWLPEGMAAKGSLHLLPGNSETVAIVHSVDDPESLSRVINEAEAFADLVIIDTPPSGGMLMAFAWQAVDYAVIPVQLEMLSMHGLMGSLRRAARSHVRLAGIVPNMVQNTALHAHYMDTLRTTASENGWNVMAPIARRIEWAESSEFRQMIFAVNAGMSKARLEAIQFCNELSKTMEPQHE